MYIYVNKMEYITWFICLNVKINLNEKKNG